MITIEEVSYGKWGRCVRLSNGSIELLATLDFGPRVIRFGYIGGTNMFCEDVNVESSASGPEFDKHYGEGATWYIRGGHRLWTSPEGDPRSYYPDNDPVAYEKIENGIILTPPEQKWTQLQMQIKITMCPETDNVTVDHYITNTGAWTVEFAAWGLTVLAKNGIEIVPQPTKDTGLLGNRVLGLWPYTKMTDERVFWGDKYITLKQNPDIDRKFKLGINSEHGFAAYILDGNMFIKRFEVNEDGNYPDGGMSFETFTNSLMLEMESVGELTKLSTGEKLSLTERWEMVKDVSGDTGTETGIEEIVNKLVI